MMSRMNECRVLPLRKQELLGYAHFLRGYAYYHILMNYGPVIIIGDEPLDTNADAEYYDRARRHSMMNQWSIFVSNWKWQPNIYHLMYPF
ncbi:MAG: hypothetical protein V8R12_13375 [Bacteroides faecis]